MSELIEASEIIQNAEQSIVKLVQKALEERDYATAESLMSLAGELRDIAARMSPAPQPATKCSSNVDSITAATGLIKQGYDRQRAKPVRRSPRRGEFPKFLRDESTLYKLGWSKAEKSEYEHKAPRHVLMVLVNTLKAVGVNRRRFTMDNILPLMNSNEDTEVPTYQVYLCLAWLRITNLIVQHGRQGYSISHLTEFESNVEKAWQKIPLIQDTRF